MKIDTEGAEVGFRGMAKALGNGLINMVIEVTPAHWFRFGMRMDNPEESRHSSTSLKSMASTPV